MHQPYPQPLLTLIAALGLCTCNVHRVDEDTFMAHSDVERDAQARMRHWVGMAQLVLDEAAVPEEERARVTEAIRSMRAALSHYNELRSRGSTRAMIIAPIEISATAIVADDATAVGLGDNILLVPLALAALGTYLVTDARASAHELGQAWNQVLTQSTQLGKAVQSALIAAGLGSRQDCIDQYVDCQQNARRSFPRGRCQVCMDRCIVSGFVWPPGRECDYR